jgi:GDP-L-fucose synthase
MNKESKIYVAGHNGMVGSACWRLLKKEGFKNLIGKSSTELDLRNQEDVFTYIKNEKPEIVIDAAAKVGGIWANNEYPFQFLMDNMLIQNNLINSSLKNNVRKFIFLGSSCIYPKNAPQPLKEEYLLTSELEPTNQWYAIAKISGVKLIESIRKQFGYDYVALMPTNLYGLGDNYDLKTSHVLPALIRKYHEAKQNGNKVLLWGTGNPLREFLHVDDLARAILLFVKNESKDYLYNIGSGQEISIRNLSELVSKVIGFNGKTKWDKSMPDGTPRKLLDSNKIERFGFKYKINLEEGIKDVYKNLII